VHQPVNIKAEEVSMISFLKIEERSREEPNVSEVKLLGFKAYLLGKALILSGRKEDAMRTHPHDQKQSRRDGSDDHSGLAEG
jgi:hypothetical protein